MGNASGDMLGYPGTNGNSSIESFTAGPGAAWGKNASEVFYSAFAKRLNELQKEASMTKQAIPGAGIAEEAAGAIGKKLAPNIFKRFGSAFGAGAQDAIKGISGKINPELPGMAEAGTSGLTHRLGYGLGQSGAGQWAYKNPGTAIGMGAGAAGMGGMKMYDNHENAVRERMMAEAPFGTRLQMALSYLFSPEAASRRLMG